MKMKKISFSTEYSLSKRNSGNRRMLMRGFEDLTLIYGTWESDYGSPLLRQKMILIYNPWTNKRFNDLKKWRRRTRRVILSAISTEPD